MFLVYQQAYEERICRGKGTKDVDRILKNAGILLETNVSINPKSQRGNTVKVRKLVIPDDQ